MMSSTVFPTLADRVFPNDDRAAPEDPQFHDNSSEMSDSGGSSPPRAPPDSPGSSVSSRTQAEFDELLRHAIVIPSYAHLPPGDILQRSLDLSELTTRSYEHMTTGPVGNTAAEAMPRPGYRFVGEQTDRERTQDRFEYDQRSDRDGTEDRFVQAGRNQEMYREDERTSSGRPPTTFLRTALYEQDVCDDNNDNNDDNDDDNDDDDDITPRGPPSSQSQPKPPSDPVRSGASVKYTSKSSTTVNKGSSSSDGRPRKSSSAPTAAGNRVKHPGDRIFPRTVKPKGAPISTGRKEPITNTVPSGQKKSEYTSSTTAAPQNQYLDQVDSAAERVTEEERVVDGRVDESMYSYTSVVDQDVSRMESLMDSWTNELKRNVLAEFSQAKIRVIEHHRQEAMKERDRHNGDTTRIQNEVESLKELLNTYEQSLERKDQVITNLTDSLQRHRDKCDVQRAFCDWKIQLNDKKREEFAGKLAQKHYDRKLAQKVWMSWHSLIVSRWQDRVEKACQSKAQDVCVALTNDYETKLASLNEALEASRVEVMRLQKQREVYEETMKKAFMRGVCALNLEAMTIFHDGGSVSGEDKDGTPRPPSSQGRVDDDDDDMGRRVTIQQEQVYSSDPTDAHLPSRSVSAHRSAPPRAQAGHTQSKQDVSKSRLGVGSKVVSAKITGRMDGGHGSSVLGPVQLSLAPPMSSVVVERHQPITKQTLGHAIASKYPRTAASLPNLLQHKITGGPPGNSFLLGAQNIQTVKVVE